MQNSQSLQITLYTTFMLLYIHLARWCTYIPKFLRRSEDGFLETEFQFSQIWQGLGGVKAWSLISTLEQGSTANSSVTVTLGNGQTRLASITLIDYYGTWKIQ